MIKSRTDSGRTVFSMDSTMLSLVIEIASKNEPTMAMMNAISIMRLVYGVEFNNFALDFGNAESRFAHLHEKKEPIINDSVKSKLYNVFPNPAKDRIFIKRIGGATGDAVKVDLKLTDITGRLLWQESNIKNGSKMEINVSNMNSGLYFIFIEDGNGKIESHKVIIEK